MSVSSATRPVGVPAAGPPSRRRGWRRPEYAVAAVVFGLAVVLALLIHAHHLQGVPGVLRGSAPGLVLFVVCGDALAQALVPAEWWPLRGVFALALGAAASGMVLMAFGVAHVPLSVSLWLTLALGLAAAVWVRRRGLGERGRVAPASGEMRWRVLAPWLAVLVTVWLVALIPAARTGADTIYGENPDASQVAGIAVLFQHVPPTATDAALPLDTVPQEWRFRYPIFYPLAAASNLSHFDPIRVFPAIVALLAVMCAFGFGMLAVQFLGAPPASGPAVAGVIGLSWILQHLAWHPYWNQLWGLALFPYAVLFGWRFVRDGGARTGVLFGLTVLMLWLAYPLALPYPLVIVGALWIAYWRRPRWPTMAGARAWIGAAVVLLLLAPAVVGAVLKLEEAIKQLVTPGSALWGGDIHRFTPFGMFAGTGGGILPALAVLALAGYGLLALPTRPRIALGAVLAALCLLDLRFRLTSSGAYMDFKHLSFVGPVVLTLAAAAVMRLIWSRRRGAVAIGALVAVAWTVAALAQDRAEGFLLPQQVTPQMFQIRQWAARLPRGASVRVDIPARGLGGYQLWAVYMLGDHPVDSPTPVLDTTYAHAAGGVRADYSLSLRYVPNANPRVKIPFPPRLFAVDPPLFENSQFVLRRIVWPKRYDNVPDTSSTRQIGS
jgi:hypothetical protein